MSQESDPKPRPWLQGAVVLLLGFQVGLLWMQGSMLERQHGDLQSLRQDVQDLSESLEQFEGNFDQGATDGAVRSFRRRPRARHEVQRVRLQDPEGDQGIRKELAEQRKSEKDAVAKAREAQSQLSLSENARKAEEKARIEAETHKYRPFIWGGVVLALLAMVLRSWLRNRG